VRIPLQIRCFFRELPEFSFLATLNAFCLKKGSNQIDVLRSHMLRHAGPVSPHAEAAEPLSDGKRAPKKRARFSKAH